MASRPNTPLLFRGKHGSSISQDLDLNGSPKSNGSISIPKPSGASKSGPDTVSVLEARANRM